jgi:hypothetical protein
MGDGAGDAVDDAHREDRVEIFRGPVGFGRWPDGGIERARRFVAAQGAAGLPQIGEDGRSTSSVSAAPQTPVRRILALSTMARALAGSAAAST